MWDPVERERLKERKAELAKEAAFRRHLACLARYAQWIRELPDETVLKYFREDGGNPDAGVGKARQWLVEGLLVYQE